MQKSVLASAVQTFTQAALPLSDAMLEQENFHWRAYEGVRYAFLQTYLELRELATKTATARMQQGNAITSAQRILAQHHCAFRELQGRLVGVHDDELDRVPAEGEWPLRVVLPHIIQTEKGFYALIHYALEGSRSGDQRPAEMTDQVALGVYHLDQFDDAHGSLTQIFSRYEALHNTILAQFAGMSEAELSIPSLWWEEENMELRFRLHRFDAHLREHTIQVEKTHEGIGHQLSEVERLLGLIYAALGEAEGTMIGSDESDAAKELAATIEARAHEVAAIQQ